MSGHSGGGGAKRDYPVGRPGQPPGPSFPLLLAQALGREKAGGRWPGSPHSMLWAPVAHTPCLYPQPLASDQCPEPATAGSPAAALPPWGTRGSGQLPRLSLNPLPADQEAQSLPQARGMWLRTVQGRRPAPTGGGGGSGCLLSLCSLLLSLLSASSSQPLVWRLRPPAVGKLQAPGLEGRQGGVQGLSANSWGRRPCPLPVLPCAQRPSPAQRARGRWAQPCFWAPLLSSGEVGCLGCSKLRLCLRKPGLLLPHSAAAVQVKGHRLLEPPPPAKGLLCAAPQAALI